MNPGFVEEYKIVRASAGQLMNATMTCDNVSLKNVVKAWWVFQCSNGTGDACVVNPLLGTAVATCTTAVTFNVKFWENADTSATDTLVAQTAGTTFATSAAATPSMVVFEIDPADVAHQAQVDAAAYDCLGCTVTGGGQVANYGSSMWILQMRYGAATPPATITD